MALSNNALSAIAIIALGLSALALIVAVSASGGKRRFPDQSKTKGLPQGDRLELLTERQGQSIRRLEGAVRQLAGGEKKLYEMYQGAVQNVGIVRFDAFEDMGGRLSFSAALLDADGDGIVITSINGRQDARCYAKPVRGGASNHNLSDEEEQAIREALSAAERQPAPAR